MGLLELDAIPQVSHIPSYSSSAAKGALGANGLGNTLRSSRVVIGWFKSW
jgi:hypothetical protein